MIDVQDLRKRMLTEKGFLRQIYESVKPQTKILINGATDIQAQILGFILLCCINGKIPVKRRTAKKLQKSRNAPFLKPFSSEKRFRKLMLKSKTDLVEHLIVFSNIFPELLHPVFN